MQIENHKEQVPFAHYEEKFRGLKPEEALEPFGDVDYEEDLENVADSESASMTPWREDSK